MSSVGPSAPAPAGRGLAVYYMSVALGFVAGQMFNYVMVVFTRAVSGSDGFTGLVYLATCVVPLVLARGAGPIIDRHDRKRLLLLAQGLWLLGALVLAILETVAQPGHLSRWALLAVGVSNGVAFTVLMPVRLAVAADVAGPGREGQSALVMNILLVVAFGLGPFLVGHARELVGWAEVLGVATALFVASELLLFGVHPPPRPRAAPRAETGWRSARALVARDPVVWQVLVATGISYLPLGPIQLLVPQYSVAVLGLDEAGRGTLMSALAAGLFLGGVAALFVNRSAQRRRAILATGIAVGALLALLPAVASPAWVAIALLGCGALGGLGAGIGAAELQSRLPTDARGRVLSIYALVVLVVPAAGGAIAGPVTDVVGIRLALELAGAVVAIGGVAAAVILSTLREAAGVERAKGPLAVAVEEARSGG